eukprot:8748458-Pyramimonas_sp.AAC.1
MAMRRRWEPAVTTAGTGRRRAARTSGSAARVRPMSAPCSEGALGLVRLRVAVQVAVLEKAGGQDPAKCDMRSSGA